MNFLVPGKTFLAGEYSVLRGAAALGLATQPCFAIGESRNPVRTFHPESPAGRYLTKFSKANSASDVLAQALHIEDPYFTRGILGGFGKSTAEFFAALSPELKQLSFTQIRQIYLDLHTTEVVKPSGADLAFQYFGHVCLADLPQNQFQSFDWPFPNLEFFVVATGLKIATYQHLAELDLKKIDHLPKQSDRVIEAFLKKDQVQFLDTLMNWCNVLANANLTHEQSLKLRMSLENESDILVAKPCGALGADVLIVVCDGLKKENVRKLLTERRLQIVASVGDLCNGVSSYVG